MTASHIGFVFSPDAWYWPALERDERAMSIGKYFAAVGCEWEFVVTERTFAPNRRLAELLPEVVPQREGVLGLQVCTFDDAWDAYTELPEFFTELAAMTRAARPGRPLVRAVPYRLEDVRDLCLRLGFTDDTPRRRT